jgi:hypothetical protein
MLQEELGGMGLMERVMRIHRARRTAAAFRNKWNRPHRMSGFCRL